MTFTSIIAFERILVSENKLIVSFHLTELHPHELLSVPQKIKYWICRQFNKPNMNRTWPFQGKFIYVWKPFFKKDVPRKETLFIKDDILDSV